MPPICLTLSVPDAAQLQRRIEKHAGAVRWIEVRLDALDRPRLPRLPQKTSSGFIATCRPRREGGGWKGSERERLQLLQQAARRGFAWIDLEHDVEQGLDLPSGVSLLRSLHDFEGMPDSLDSVFQSLRGRGHAVKMALTVNRSDQLVRLLDWMSGLPRQERRVVLGMGRIGQPSRLLGAFLGNLWTYLAEEDDNPAAPAQFSLRQARLYRLQSWTRTPSFYGVMGRPVAHSLSPLLHNRLLARYNLEGVYLPVHLDDLEPWMGWLQRTSLSFQGFSVTLPFKREIMDYLAQNDSPIGSVNTLSRIPSGGWRGSNTDYQGFIGPLRARGSLRGGRALVLGNGGVARTVVRALLDEGMEVTVVGRDQARAQALAQQMGCGHATFKDLPISAQVCVNTTPVGQHPHTESSPLQASQVDFEVVYDLIYNPRRTRLLREAESRGCQIISGLEMFIEQAALQFRMWTGIDPDRRFMKDVLDRDAPPGDA
ncbi:MAG TPA: type I 3-dehydroquinate dehydratase [Acidobacteriota bacterium]|nr:type I 3-dehydroquinate dehydratase [Acidobacteriota bacterium]